ncbi:SURF1 family cytochrome oxidase biogenesis protein [Microbacteriaceae bacterium 4G12]
MLAIMRRPKWIGLLVLALAVAAAFAALGQWQLSRAVEEGVVVERATEEAVPLTSVVQPQQMTEQKASGQVVTVRGAWAPGDYGVVSERVNGGRTGYWVVGRFDVALDGVAVAADAPGLAVGLGWSADREDAEQRRDALIAGDPSDEVTENVGRFLPTEGPNVPDDDEDPFAITSMSVAALVNTWQDFDDRDAYSGYVVLTQAPAGLVDIDSPAPSDDVRLNWLNIFYAAEWVIFAGFAVFIWYRLVRDELERETEEAEEAAAAAEAGAAAGGAAVAPAESASRPGR